jgi:hypothetical protein
MFAFKEWTLVCSALGRGEQSLIIRKGGIAEGRAGFRFLHPQFLLFPTFFHEQVSKLRLPPQTPLPAASTDPFLSISWLARVEWTADIVQWPVVEALEPFHIWSRAEIEKRFHQDGKPGVSAAMVRIFKLPAPHRFPDSPKFGGCRSWVEVPDLPPGAEPLPVIDDTAHRERESAIRALLGRII